MVITPALRLKRENDKLMAYLRLYNKTMSKYKENISS